MKQNTTPTEKKQLLSVYTAGNASQKPKETTQTLTDHKSLNERFVYKRYSFNGNGNGYQGL